jgi:prepilin-type N-terminal cleavage/methylation domain-containing protein
MIKNGFTLLEVIVVCGIIGTLAAISFVYTKPMLGKSGIETKVKELNGDLIEAKEQALDRSRIYYVTFPTVTEYRIYEDSDGDGALNPAKDNMVLQKGINPSFVLTAATHTIAFDARGLVPTGLVGTKTNIWMHSAEPPELEPGFDCVEIRSTIIRIGAWDVGSNTCSPR